MIIGQARARGGGARSALLAAIPAIALFGLAILLLFAVAFAGMYVTVTALCGAILLAWIAWQWPTPTVIALVVLITLARFISFAAFAATGSESVLRASQLWKDEVLVVLAVRMLHDVFLRGQAPRLHYLDIVIGLFILLTAAYVFFPGLVPGSSYFIRGLAFRQDALYLLAYFIGRGVTLRRRHVRMMLVALIGLSIVISAIAVIQFAFPSLSNYVLNVLGYDEFTAAVGTPHEVEFVRSRVLASGELPRASSLFLADLGLAFYQVLMIPLAAALFFSLRHRANQLGAGLFLLLMLGTMAMTVARAPLAGAALGLIVLTVLSRSFIKAAWTTLGLVSMFLLFVVVSGVSPQIFVDLFSSQESSAEAHTNLISRSLDLVWAQPFGLGLGNGSHVSILASGLGEAGLPTWATETWYLQMGLEMGVLGMLLFAIILLTATFQSLLSGLRVRDVWLRSLSLGVAGGGIGFLFVSAYHPVWAAVQVTFLFWLFVGIAVRAPVLEAEWAAEEPR